MGNRTLPPILNNRVLVLIAGSATCAVMVAVAFFCFLATRPPSIDGFRYRGGDFVSPAATDVAPIYGNDDVPSIIGRYSVHGIPCGQVLRSIDRQAAAAHWITVRKSQERGEYVRDRQLVRVAVRNSDSECRIAVGWLMFDIPASSAAAPLSHRARWARENLWPRFEKALRN